MALLSVLVSALQDRILLQSGHCFLLVDAAQPGLRILLAAAEVDPSLDLALLTASPRKLAVTVVVANEVADCQPAGDQQNKSLKKGGDEARWK